MLDIFSEKLSNLQCFTDNNWDTVVWSTPDTNYLHIKMDKHFYDFLIELDGAKSKVDDGYSSLPEETERLKELYDTDEPELQEYVILPRNEFIEIITDSENNRKCLSEVINLFYYSDYPKAKLSNKRNEPI